MAEIPLSLLYRLLSLQWDYCVELTEDQAQILKKRGTEKLPFSKIRSKAVIKDGLIWDNIIFASTEQGRFTISGVKKAHSEQSIATLNRLLGQYHLKEVQPAYQRIPGSYQKFKSIFGHRYTRHSAVERWRKDNAGLIGQLNNPFALDVLPEQEKSIVAKFPALFSKSHEIREKQNRKFVVTELTNYQEFFDTVENNPLTERQRLACVVNEDNNLALAGAGSGKTSVIIAKAGYLIRSGLAKPHEILILAYGRKASQETNERIREKLPHIQGVTTSTFHKLGLDIIGKVTGEKPRVSKLQEDTAEFYKLINGIITELARLDKPYNQRVIDYFVTHLIPYKDEFEYAQQGDYFTALKEGDLQSIKSRIEWAEIRNGRKSLQQETLKSFEEVVIADFLFVNGITYRYEQPYEVPTATAERPQYQPDFYLPEYRV